MGAESLQPGVLFLRSLLAGILGGFLIILTVHAMFEREVETWQGLLGVTAGLSLTAATISHAASPWYYALLLLILWVAAAFALGRAVEARVRERQMLAEDARRYQEAITADDRNAAAHAYLGEVYYRQGRLEDAIAEYETATELDREDTEARSRLKTLVRHLQEREGVMLCPLCGRTLDAVHRACPDCGWSRAVVRGQGRRTPGEELAWGVAAAGASAAGVAIAGLILQWPAPVWLAALLGVWLVCALLFLAVSLRGFA